MKIIFRRLKVGLFISAFQLLSISAFSQGSLTPPGAPAATFKTLDQVEPRTLIKSLPFTISNSGSYYLTASLTPAAGNAGITVNASNVTIDLNGFELIGTGGAGSGVLINSGVSNVTARNGTIRNWSINGIKTNTNPVVRAENLVVRSCAQGGLLLTDKAFVSRCYVEACGVTGLSVLTDSIIQDCQVVNTTGSPGHGIIVDGNFNISNCVASNNAGTGIAKASASAEGLISNCVTNYNHTGGITVQGRAITNCVANNNGANGNTPFPNATGINVFDGCSISHCTAHGNTGYGLLITFSDSNREGGAVENSAFNGNTLGGIECDSAAYWVIRHCSASLNDDVGIKADYSALVAECVASNNAGDGIHTGQASQILRNECVNNGGDGILGEQDARIEGNNVVMNVIGIHVTGVHSLIIHNTARNNTTNYNIAAQNRYGQILDLTAAQNTAPSGNSAASTASSNDAQANFAY